MKTKKMLVMVFIFMFMTGAVNAQLLIGPEVGYGVSFLTNSENIIGESGGAKLNPLIGVTLRTSQEKLFGIRTGIHYTQKGTRYSDFETYKFIMHYLEIPISANLMIGKGKVRGVVDVGPYLGFWLKAAEKYAGEKETLDFGDVEGEKRLDVGLNVGGGVAITELGPGTLMITAKVLGFGFIPIFDTDDTDGAVRNIASGISVAYLFALGD